MVATFTAENVVQKGNSLTVKLSFTDSNNSHYNSNSYATQATLTSPEYLINCRVVFQAKVIRHYQSLLYFVKFTKKHTSDKLAYLMKYSDKIDDITSKDKCEINFTLESGCWQLIDEFKVQRCTWYVSVVLTVPAPGNPCVSLYDDTELTDLELRGADGSVHLHKSIAAAYSPVIKTGLTGEWAKPEKRAIDAPPETSKATLLDLKQYMYIGVIPKSSSALKQLLILASFYMMPDLEQRCVQDLLAQVTSEQSHDLFEFAMKHQMSNLLFGMMYHVQNGALDVDQMLKYRKV